MSLMNLLAQAQGGKGLGALAEQFGLDENQINDVVGQGGSSAWHSRKNASSAKWFGKPAWATQRHGAS